jgi:hypothetical protein
MPPRERGSRPERGRVNGHVVVPVPKAFPNAGLTAGASSLVEFATRSTRPKVGIGTLFHETRPSALEGLDLSGGDVEVGAHLPGVSPRTTHSENVYFLMSRRLGSRRCQPTIHLKR